MICIHSGGKGVIPYVECKNKKLDRGKCNKLSHGIVLKDLSRMILISWRSSNAGPGTTKKRKFRARKKRQIALQFELAPAVERECYADICLDQEH